LLTETVEQTNLIVKPLSVTVCAQNGHHSHGHKHSLTCHCLTSRSMMSWLKWRHSSTTGWPKKLAQFLYALTLPNINQFSKLFHSQNQEKICNNTITKDPTTPLLLLLKRLTFHKVV